MRLDNLLDAGCFISAKELAIDESKRYSGIGRLGEKTLHRTLKYLLEPDSSYHEVEFLGSVADIKNQEGIIEIQTRELDKLAPKLEKFLPQINVTIVHPVIERKTIHYIDTYTGESLPPRKSPIRKHPHSALPELAKLLDFIPNDNLTIFLVFINAEDIRRLHGKIRVGRKSTAKIDCIPTSVNSVLVLNKTRDYIALLPKNLLSGFTAAEFERITRLKGLDAHISIKFLMKLGVLTREKGDGGAYLYSVNAEI